MKTVRSRLAIVCSLLLVLALASSLADTVPATARFSRGDMNVCYVYAGASKDIARMTFGEPTGTESVTFGATEETVEIWHYPGLDLTFSSEDILIIAEVSDAAYLGPRGVALGMSLEDVVTRFYLMDHAPAGSVLYTAGYVEDLDAQLPPCGFIQQSEDGTFYVVYAAPTTPFGEDVLSDPMNFIYQQLATFTVIFDKDSLVTGYSWSLGAWAE